MNGNALHTMRSNIRRRTLAATVLTVAVIGAAAGASVAFAQDAEVLAETMQVSGTFDGANKRYVGGGGQGDGGQAEGQDALFELADGATLKNVTIGAPAADGVHCSGSCTLLNITWEDVGEDAATFRGSNAEVLVDGGSASGASDKVFQDNRDAGGMVTIRNFTVNGFGKVYRSCGTCGEVARSARLENITASGGTDSVAGVNANFGDKVTLSGIKVDGDTPLCGIYESDPAGGEPKKVATEPDGKSCIVEGQSVSNDPPADDPVDPVDPVADPTPDPSGDTVVSPSPSSDGGGDDN